MKTKAKAKTTTSKSVSSKGPGLSSNLITPEAIRYVREHGLLKFLNEYKNLLILHFLGSCEGSYSGAMKEMKYQSNRIYEKVEGLKVPSKKGKK